MVNKQKTVDVWRAGSWRPMFSGGFRDLSRLQRSIDRMFLDLWEPLSPWQEEGGEYGFTPSVDVEDLESHYLLSFDLPGVSKNDVKIELRDNQLIVSGERKSEGKKESLARLSSERYYGFFQRMFTLPSAVEAEKIEANFESGVLQIAVPKTTASKPKLVEVKEEKGGFFQKLLGHQQKTHSGKPEKAA